MRLAGKAPLTNKTSAIHFVIMIILYRLIIDYAYRNIISTLFAYEGFRNYYSPLNGIISYIVLSCFIAVIIPVYKNIDTKISNEILLVLFVLYFVPFTSMFSFGVFSIWFMKLWKIYGRGSIRRFFFDFEKFLSKRA